MGEEKDDHTFEKREGEEFRKARGLEEKVA